MSTSTTGAHNTRKHGGARHLFEPTDSRCQGISAPRIVNQVQYQNIAVYVSYADKSSLAKPLILLRP